MIRINNNSPIVDVEVPELLRPKSTITFVTNSVKSMLDKNGSTHTCRLQTDGRIVALGNSHQDNGIFFTLATCTVHIRHHQWIFQHCLN